MKKLNLIIVYNKKLDKVLMCKREKNPYKGKLNFVGGKVEENEDELEAAYRELKEETGIAKKDIDLVYLMKFNYMISDFELEVFIGNLKEEITIIEELNKIYWIDINTNFFDLEKFAGDGNIGHMMKHAERYYKREL